jgi:hypothetical protein
MSNREPMTLEQAIEFLYNLMSGRDDLVGDDELEYAEASEVAERRTRRDHVADERPRRHREPWGELETQAALDLTQAEWSQRELGELLEREPEAVRRMLARQKSMK